MSLSKQDKLWVEAKAAQFMAEATFHLDRRVAMRKAKRALRGQLRAKPKPVPFAGTPLHAKRVNKAIENMKMLMLKTSPVTM